MVPEFQNPGQKSLLKLHDARKHTKISSKFEENSVCLHTSDSSPPLHPLNPFALSHPLLRTRQDLCARRRRFFSPSAAARHGGRTSVYIQSCICTHVCIYVCIIYVCKYAYLCVCMLVCMYLYMYACMYIFCLLFCSMYVCIHVRACMYEHMYVHMHACIHVCKYSCIHVCIHASDSEILYLPVKISSV